jgi:hypothetical protein
MGSCTDVDKASHLPKDVLRFRTTRQDHRCAAIQLQVTRRLNDKDVVGAAVEGDVLRGEIDISGEGVDARSQGFATDESSLEIEDARVIAVRATGGVGVRSLHVADRFGHLRRSGCGVGRRVYTLPVICSDVENSPLVSRGNAPKPVMYDAATGETPMSPTMTEVSVTVEMPVFERIAKSAAVPRGTTSSAEVTALQAATSMRTKREALEENIMMV